MNGAAEATNKNMKKIIWKMMICFDLHVYHMSVRTSTEATTYSLIYDMEVVLLPVEVKIPSLKIMHN
ncbi:hypothetical protein Lal_00004109 [Lupinus albus]|nr:hypothetical protein Lal_00004109 [Lupinus albus]